MSDFSELRKEAFDVLKRMLDELSEKPQFGQYDANTLEKVVKTCILLETQASKSGRDSGYKEAPTEDLEEEFE